MGLPLEEKCLGHQFNIIPSNILIPQHHQVIIPGSNLFRVGYMDGGTLRQDTWYSWRRTGEEVARSIFFFWDFPILIQARNAFANVEVGQGWELDKDPPGSPLLSSLEGVKYVVATLVTERVWSESIWFSIELQALDFILWLLSRVIHAKVT